MARFEFNYFFYIFVLKIDCKMVRFEKKDVCDMFGERYRIDGLYDWDVSDAVRFIRRVLNSNIKDNNGCSLRYDMGEVILSNDYDIKRILLGQSKVLTLAIVFLNVLRHTQNKTTQRLINGMLFKTVVIEGKVDKVFVFDIVNKDLKDEFNGLINGDLSEGKIKRIYDAISKRWLDIMESEQVELFFNKFFLNTSYKSLDWDTRNDMFDISLRIDFKNRLL